MSELILKELRNKRTYLKVSFVALTIFSLFLCINHYLPLDDTAKRTHLSSGIPIGANAPNSGFDYFTVSELSETQQVQNQMVERINNVATWLQNREEYNRFATILAHETANNGWPEKYKISLLSHILFPKQENQLQVDYIKLNAKLTSSDVVRDVYDYLANKGVIKTSRTNQYRLYGIGFAHDGHWLTVAIVLIKPIFEYTEVFPSNGAANMEAVLVDTSVNDVEINHHSLSRGWLAPVNETMERIKVTASVGAGTLRFSISPPEQGWSNIEFIIDGESIGPGRVLLPEGHERTDLMAMIENGHLNQPQNTVSQSAIVQANIQANRSLNPVYQAALEHINKSRLPHGLSALEWNDVASSVAQSHCDETVVRGYVGHWGQDGSQPYHRYHRVGGTGGVSENLAWFCQGFQGAEGLQGSMVCDRDIDASNQSLSAFAKRSHDAFMAEVPPDDGHRQTVLNRHHTGVGIGYAVSKGQFAYCEEYVRQYLELASGLQSAVVGQEFELSGRVLATQAYGIYAISITYDPPLVEYLDENQPRSYNDYGAVKVQSIAPWALNYQTETGEFFSSFKPTKAGLYYVQYYVKDDPHLIPYQPTTSRSYPTANAFVGGAQIVHVSD